MTDTQKLWYVYAIPARLGSQSRPVEVVRHRSRGDIDNVSCEAYNVVLLAGESASAVRRQYREQYPHVVRPCGNCGHMGSGGHGLDAKRDCRSCECPEFDHAMSDDQRKRGECRWASHKAHTGACSGCR